MTYYPVVGPIQTMGSPADQVSITILISYFHLSHFIFPSSINIVFLDQVTFVVLAFPYFSFSYFPLLICAELYFRSRPFLLFCSASRFQHIRKVFSFSYYNFSPFHKISSPGCAISYFHFFFLMFSHSIVHIFHHTFSYKNIPTRICLFILQYSFFSFFSSSGCAWKTSAHHKQHVGKILIVNIII